MNRPSSLTQVMDLQAIALSNAKDPNVPSHVKAAHMRAWVDLEDIRLRLRGIGAPKPVEARNASPKRKARPTVSPVRVSTSTQPAPPTESAP